MNTPDGFKRMKSVNGKYTIRKGSATGHAHVIYDIAKCEVFIDEDGEIRLYAHEPVKLIHEEHHVTVLPKGWTHFGVVIEKVPGEEKRRQITD